MTGGYGVTYLSPLPEKDLAPTAIILNIAWVAKTSQGLFPPSFWISNAYKERCVMQIYIYVI